MKYFLTILILTFILPSCISYHIAEKDLFNINKVSKLNDDIKLEEVYFETSDSLQLYGWFVKHNNPRGTFLYFGGDGFYLWNRLTPDVINMLTSFNMNLLLIDYRGYGRSEGSPTIQGIYKDGEAAYKYLCSRNDVDSTKIILYGHSLGTFVAVHLGSIHTTAGIILEAPISNASEMSDAVLNHYAPWYIRWLVNISADSTVLNLDNIKQIQKIKQPLLVITGSEDNLAPPKMGKKVYNAAHSSIKRFKIIPNGQHKNLYFNNKGGRREFFINAVSEYLNDVLNTK